MVKLQGVAAAPVLVWMPKLHAQLVSAALHTRFRLVMVQLGIAAAVGAPMTALAERMAAARVAVNCILMDGLKV